MNSVKSMTKKKRQKVVRDYIVQSSNFHTQISFYVQILLHTFQPPTFPKQIHWGWAMYVWGTWTTSSWSLLLQRKWYAKTATPKIYVQTTLCPNCFYTLHTIKHLCCTHQHVARTNPVQVQETVSIAKQRTGLASDRYTMRLSIKSKKWNTWLWIPQWDSTAIKTPANSSNQVKYAYDSLVNSRILV